MNDKPVDEYFFYYFIPREISFEVIDDETGDWTMKHEEYEEIILSVDVGTLTPSEAKQVDRLACVWAWNFSPGPDTVPPPEYITHKKASKDSITYSQLRFKASDFLLSLSPADLESNPVRYLKKCLELAREIPGNGSNQTND